jgi:hypothetical protein
MKKVILIVISLIAFVQMNAQIAVGYFPFQSIVSLTTNTEKKFWVDYKVETNTFFTNMNMELSVKYNFKKNTQYNLYVAPGFVFNFTNPSAGSPFANGYFIDFGSRIKPLEKNKHVQLVFELSPYVNYEFKSGNLRSRLGIAYQLQ